MKTLTDREKIQLVIDLDYASQRFAQGNRGGKGLQRLMEKVSAQLVGRKLTPEEKDALFNGFFLTPEPTSEPSNVQPKVTPTL